MNAERIDIIKSKYTHGILLNKAKLLLISNKEWNFVDINSQTIDSQTMYSSSFRIIVLMS